MKKKYFLGLDQGTTGTTSLIFDENWNIVAHAYKEHKQYYPQPGWVEHDPLEIWHAVLEAIDNSVQQAGITEKDLTCIGLDNQGETVMLWDKDTGKPLYNAIVWQDRRTSKYADELSAMPDVSAMIADKCGMRIDAYFSATKIRWILDNVEGAKEKAKNGKLLAGTLDTWMIWKFTKGKSFVTDCSTASRTMLLNIHTGTWDDDILKLLDIPKNILPEIYDSACLYGVTSKDVFFGAEVPISGSVVDQQAALFGQACYKLGDIKTTYGTGCFMLMNTGDAPISSKNNLLTTIAWRFNNKMTFALDAGIYIAGAAVSWLKDGLKIIDKSSYIQHYASSVPDNGGVYFVPAFVGLAAPHWDQYARGTLVGITAGTTREHICRATEECIAYQVKDNLDVLMMDTNIKVERMRVDGGAVNDSFLMQFQADILNIPVDVPVINETTALGAAYIAALGIGEFSSLEEIASKWKLKRTYEPNMSSDQREYLLSKWHRAIERSKKWEVD